jgi:hypothetical protein
MPEKDIKRLIIQLLILKVLKEQFETQTIRGINVKKINVFLVPGRVNLIKNLEQNMLPVYLSDGVLKENYRACDFAKDSKEDFPQKH